MYNPGESHTCIKRCWTHRSENTFRGGYTSDWRPQTYFKTLDMWIQHRCVCISKDDNMFNSTGSQHGNKSLNTVWEREETYRQRTGGRRRDKQDVTHLRQVHSCSRLQRRQGTEGERNTGCERHMYPVIKTETSSRYSWPSRSGRSCVFVRRYCGAEASTVMVRTGKSFASEGRREAVSLQDG